MLPHILTYGAQIGHVGKPTLILSDNLGPSLINPVVITKQVDADLELNGTSLTTPCPPFICSP